MRSALRWLTLAPLTLLLLFTFHYFRPAVLPRILPTPSLLDSIGLPRPSATSQTGSGLPDHVSDPINAFWKHWSEVICNARPHAPAIVLHSLAETRRPGNSRGSRQPYFNHVQNTKIDIASLQESHAQFVEQLSEQDGKPLAFSGRGVVMVGGGEYFGPAIIGIHMLRRTGSTIPVEIFVPNDQEYETELCDGYLPRLNSRCVVLSRILSYGSKLDISHYQLKSLALLLSSFAEVLLLDSDSIPLSDPNVSLFESASYTSTGLVIWPDFWTATESPYFWTIAGQGSFPSDLPVTSSEAGQLLINKYTHLKTLLLATYYNVFGPDYYYPLLSQGALGQGDKETFMAAAVVLNQSYHRVKTPVSTLSRHNGEETKGTAMIQYLPSIYDDGDQQEAPSEELSSNSNNDNEGIPAATVHSIPRPAFVHTNTPKMNAGHLVDEGDLFTVDGQDRLRLMGSREEQTKLFGFDLEHTVWELLVQTGCELAHSVREWKARDRLCQRLQEHFEAVFKADGTTDTGNNHPQERQRRADTYM